MRFRRSIRISLLCCVLLSGCAESASEATQGYIVRPQDTLYSIAWRHNLDFRDLAKWNHIGPDFRISVGQVLVLRPSRGPMPATPPARAASSVTPATGTRAGPGGGAASGAASRGGVTQRWVWPTNRTNAPATVSGGGILLPGILGQDVRAANGGRVVYTGSGLRGYGNLIIIKHGDSLLSAYAHNREVIVHEGQDVTAGQVIAHMGEDAHGATLYFEIRLNGRPVDPLPFMPAPK